VRCIVHDLGDYELRVGCSMNDLISFLVTNDKLVTQWTAISALVVSFLSLISTIANFAMQRRHNRKSVQPIGHISVGDYENKIFVRLRNDGIGPMIVKAVKVRDADTGEVKTSIFDFLPDLPDDYRWSTFVRDMTNRAISANDHLTLVLLEGSDQDESFVTSRQLARRIISKLTIEVTYENIYGEKMAPALRKLDWFGRLL
jgi:hypothetical protein